MKVSVWPAKRGDCILVEYGQGANAGRILVDCGFKSSYNAEIKRRLSELDSAFINLLVVTHVDLDHVNGVLEMMEDAQRPVDFGDIWFNAFEHLEGKRFVPPPIDDDDDDDEAFGGAQGEELSLRLRAERLPWNKAFDGGPVATAVPLESLGEGVKITLLSPTLEQLVALQDKWTEECERAGLKPGVDPEEPVAPGGFESFGALTVVDVHELAAEDFEAEHSKSNGSTIAMLIEETGDDPKRVLLTGDASAEQLKTAIEPLAVGGRLKLDLMQVPHHGSKGNISKDLLDLVECSRYVVSTDGSTFGHPHQETLARLLAFGGDQKELFFNYRDRANPLQSVALKDEFKYELGLPEIDNDGEINIPL